MCEAIEDASVGRVVRVRELLARLAVGARRDKSCYLDTPGPAGKTPVQVCGTLRANAPSLHQVTWAPVSDCRTCMAARAWRMSFPLGRETCMARWVPLGWVPLVQDSFAGSRWVDSFHRLLAPLHRKESVRPLH